MRGPKRNIAQRAAERSLKKEKEPTNVIHVGDGQIKKIEKNEEKEEKPIYCSNAKWDGTLYPSKLWQTYTDIDNITYNKRFLSEKEIEEIYKRTPQGLISAEKHSDKLLSDFVSKALNTMGADKYSSMLKDAMTDRARELLALRCVIASFNVDGPKNKIEIYHNKVMNSWDFYDPKYRTTVMIDGKPSVHITHETDNKKPYNRSEEFKSLKHKFVAKTFDHEQSKKDKLPVDSVGFYKEILKDFGHDIQSHDQAWKILSSLSKNSSVEDRILARIAYLIVNASVNKDKKYLNG